MTSMAAAAARDQTGASGAATGATTGSGPNERSFPQGAEVLLAARWETLVDALAEALLAETSGRGLFVRPTVVLPARAPGLRRWLRDALTTRLGVLSQVRWVTELAFLEELAVQRANELRQDAGAGAGARDVEAGHSPPPPAPASHLARLLATLGALDEVTGGATATDPKFASVRRYLARDPRLDDGKGRSDGARSRAQSAHTIAFAQEIVRTLGTLERHRPDAIAITTGNEEVPAWLCAVGATIHARLGTTPLFERLTRSSDPSSGRLSGSTTHWFGLSSLDAVSIEAITRAGGAGETPLRVYVWAPRRADETEAAHTSARQSPGAAVVDNWSSRFDQIERALVSRGTRLTWLAASSSSAPPTTTLGRLQGTIRHPPEAQQPSPLGSDDDSLTLHGCHGPRRQVEVLHDALLALLSRHPDLAPRDIRILTPSIDTYAPILEAVFASGDASLGKRLPLAFPTPTRQGDGSIEGVVARAVALVDARFEVGEVLGLLGEPAVRARMALSRDDLLALETWLAETFVRWGRDGAHRADVVRGGATSPQEADEAEKAVLRARDETTWAFGLDRLVLSITSPPDTPPFFGRIPSIDWEGGSARIAAALLRFATVLRHHLAIWTTPTHLQGWIERTSALLDALAGGGGQGGDRETGLRRRDDDSELEEAERKHAAERDAMERLRRAWTRASFTRPGAPDPLLDASGFGLIWADAIGEGASAEGRRMGFGGPSGIVVAPLSSATALPARVVALLGLDEDVFPGAETPLSLARLGAARPLDPRRRDEDRAALVQALLSAEDHVVVTLGLRHPQTHAVRPPATPVAELFELIDASFTPPPAAPRGSRAHHALLHHHPLQPFDERAFGTKTRQPTSHDTVALALAEALRSPHRSPDGRPMARPSRPGWFDTADAPLSLSLPSDTKTDIALSDLVAFFRDPLAALLRARLGASLPPRDDEPERRREPLSLDALSRWKLREAYLRGALDAHGGGALRRARGADGGGRWEEALHERLRATGWLPVGGRGEAELLACRERFARLRSAASSLLDEAARAESRLVDVRVPGGSDDTMWRVTGAIAGHTDHGLVRLTLSDPSRPNRLLEAWISLLAVADSAPQTEYGDPVTARLVGVNGKEQIESIVLCAPNDPAIRRRLLARLLDLRRAGLAAPLPFAPSTSRAFLDALRKDQQKNPGHTDEEARYAGYLAATRVWHPDDGGFGVAEGAGELAQAVYGARCPADPTDAERERGEQVHGAFAAIADEVWGPLLDGATVEILDASTEGELT